MNTIESNKLIAEFMGAKLFVNDGAIILYKLNSKTYHIGSMNYDTDYNWLMPVVEKIEGLGHDVSILKNAVGLQWCGIGKFSSNNTKATGTTKIEAIYSAVVEFIKWYNKQNKD
jgi:hypothetical protein